MSTTVLCPKCQRPFLLEKDLVGKYLECPKCATWFSATVNAPESVTAGVQLLTGETSLRQLRPSVDEELPMVEPVVEQPRRERLSFAAVPFQVHVKEDSAGTMKGKCAAELTADGLLIRKVLIWQLMPYIFSAFRYAFGMTWKIVALAETFGLKYGIGYMFTFWFEQFNMQQVLAWVILFVALMLILEHGLIARVEERVFAWRPAHNF